MLVVWGAAHWYPGWEVGSDDIREKDLVIEKNLSLHHFTRKSGVLGRHCEKKGTYWETPWHHHSENSSWLRAKTHELLEAQTLPFINTTVKSVVDRKREGHLKGFSSLLSLVSIKSGASHTLSISYTSSTLQGTEYIPSPLRLSC